LLYDYTHVDGDTIKNELNAAIARAEELLASAGASVAQPSFINTMVPIEQAIAVMSEGAGRSSFLGNVHPDEAVREVAQQAEAMLGSWTVSLAFRDELHAAVAAFAQTPEAKSLRGERARLLTVWQRDFHRAGADLAPEAREELQQLQGRLMEVQLEFNNNLNEFSDHIEVTQQQLAGMPEEYIAQLSPGVSEDAYFITLDYPQLYPFLEMGFDRASRERLFRKHWSRCREENRLLMEEALRLRQRIAIVLGEPSWAHVTLDMRMADTPDKVRKMYEEMTPVLTAARDREIETMTAMLHADGHDGALMAWDWRFYDDQLRRNQYGVDQLQIAEYFPLEQVMTGLLDLSGEVFGLRYVKLDDALAWDASVEAYEIRDRESDELLGIAYTDLFPREGKFGHAAAMSLRVAHRLDGSRELPYTAMVANFTPPYGDRPALLRHEEVKTLLHEWGHILHMTLSQTESARLSAGQVEGDFIEAPSQIMEHWAWDAKILSRFARHYQTNDPIAPELVEQLVAARNLNIGLNTATQVFYGMLDMALHDGSDSDLDALLRESFAIMGLPYPEDTAMLSGFAHIMSGYDAGYYGYLWAQVIGDDMFGRFVNPIDPEVGRQYRQLVLEPNASLPAADMVRSFLGRDPSSDAFMVLRGLRDS